MISEEEFYFSFGYCVFMLALFLFFKAFPPKKINHLYGYRTPRSMANQIVWLDANTYSLKLGVKVMTWCLMLPLLYFLIWPEKILLATIITHSISLFIIIAGTERYLNDRYDKKGQPKNQNSKD